MLSRPIMAASIASRQLDHQRDDPAVRKVDAIDLRARLEEYGFVLQLHRLEVGSQQLQVRGSE
jgi:hypothetical protein